MRVKRSKTDISLSFNSLRLFLITFEYFGSKFSFCIRITPETESVEYFEKILPKYVSCILFEISTCRNEKAHMGTNLSYQAKLKVLKLKIYTYTIFV